MKPQILLLAGALLWHAPLAAQSERAKSQSTGSEPTTVTRLSNGVVVTGIVTGEPLRDEMTVHARNGQRYQVHPHSGVNTADYRIGDRVRVYGNLDGRTVKGANIQTLSSAEYERDEGRSGTTSTQNGSIPRTRALRMRAMTGVVTSNPAGNRFTMRAGNGYSYAVKTMGAEPSGLTEGDRVRVYGTWQKGQVQAGNVRILRQGRPFRNYNRHTLVGVVTQNLDGARFVLRANNTTYQVLAAWGEPSTLSVGDRVRAYGDWKSGMMHATNVRVLREGRVNTAPRRSTPPTRTPEVSPLAVSLRADHGTYGRGETVNFTIEVRNTGTTVQTLHFNSGQSVELTATRAGTTTPLWHWSHDRVFTQAVRDISLEPGASHSFRATWDQTNNIAEPASAGRYVIRATVTTSRPLQAEPIVVVLAGVVTEQDKLLLG